LKASVTSSVGGLSGQPKLDRLRTLLMNLARTGTERDGTNALFNVLYDNRASSAKRDLPYLGRTSSQVAAMKALADISELGDPAAITPETTRKSRIDGARLTVQRFALGEVPFGSGKSDTQDPDFVALRNAILDVGAGRGSREAVTSAAKGDSANFANVADLLFNSLDSTAKIQEAADSVKKYAVGKAITNGEKSAIDKIVNAIVGKPDAGMVEGAASDLLAHKFEECALPAMTTGSTVGFSITEKGRRIAHILYHIDADRFAKPDDRKEWHGRVASVIGMNEYVRVAEAQATEYNDAVQRMIATIADEEGSFAEEFQSNVQRIYFLYSQYLSLEAQNQTQQAILKDNQKLLAERITERDSLKARLAKAQEDARDSLEKLKGKQQSLLKIQMEYRDAQSALRKLEQDLQRLELTQK
jgi:hypothetical protein